MSKTRDVLEYYKKQSGPTKPNPIITKGGELLTYLGKLTTNQANTSEDWNKENQVALGIEDSTALERDILAGVSSVKLSLHLLSYVKGLVAALNTEEITELRGFLNNI